MGIGKSILAGLAINKLSQNVTDSQEESATETEVDKTMPKESPDRAVPAEQVGDKMDQLVATQQKSNPSPESVDGYDSTSVTLGPGQSVIIETRPRSGLRLKVKQVYFDRRDDFNYEFLIDGEQFTGGNSNRVKFNSPRVVSGEGVVVAKATNNSAATETIDWEIESWGEPV